MTAYVAQQNANVAAKPTTEDTNGHNGSNRQIPMPSGDDLLLQLAGAAKTGDAQAFANASRLIDWSTRAPDEFERAIHWALTAGAHLAARALATIGATKYPDHAELQKAARILAPPKVLRRDLPADPTIRANHDWLSANRAQYSGQWVALHNGQLLATAQSFRTLLQQVAVTPEILFTKVI